MKTYRENKAIDEILKKSPNLKYFTTDFQLDRIHIAEAQTELCTELIQPWMKG